MNEAEAVNEDLRGLMAQGEKMAAFANKQSGYEGGVSSPVRGVLAAMAAAGAPDFDGDEDLKAYWTRRLTKAIETQIGRKYMSGLNENIQQYIDREDDISDIRGKKAGEDYKTIRIDFNKPMFGDLKNAVGSYARKKYGDNIELDWRDSQEVEIDINRDLNEMARTSNIFKLKDGAGLKDVLQFMQRVNDVLKTYKSPGQKRPKKRFTPEEMKALAKAMLKPEGFTSKDIIAATSYTSPAQANKFLAALEQKGLITIISILKKSLVPDRDPNAPETRGRKAQSAEFDTSDDPTGMDFSDFDNLDLSDPTALYEGEEDTITGEYEGKPVKFKIKDIEGIKDILNRSKGAKDFVNKLSMAVTDETSSLSKEDIKKVILFYKNQGKQLKENENIKVNVNKEEDEVEVTYKGESYKSALGDELLFIHYFEDDEYHSENDAPEIFKYLKGKGGELEVDDKEATLTIKMSDLKANNNINENNNMSNNLTKHIRQQILEAKNPLAAKLKEVEAQGRIAALESKLAAIQELVEETNGRLTRIDEDSEFSEMMDKKAVKDVRKQLKELERAEAKIQKEYDKVSGGRKKETVVDEDYDEDPTTSTNDLNENLYTASEDDFGQFIDDFASTVGSDNNVEMGQGPIVVGPENFQAWDEFGYEKHWNRIPDGQPFKITGDTVGLTDYPSLKNYTFTKSGNVIKGKSEEDNMRFEGLKGVHDLKPMVTMNESLLRMQKLAGLITEGEFAKRKSLNEKYENNEDLVSTDEVLKVLKPVVGKLDNTPLGQVLQYFMGNLKSPETSMKDGYDNGGSRLQSMLTKLKDEDYEASQQFQREISAAFDVAAGVK